MSNFLDEQGLSRLWGHILNKLGGKVDKVNGKGLSANDYTDEEKDKLNKLNYATEEDVETMLEELFPTPSIPTGAIVLTCADGYTNLHTNEDIYIISGLNRLWEDDIDQTCYLLWKPDSSYSQAEHFEAQFEYISYEIIPGTGMWDGYYTIKFTNPLTNVETVYCIYDYYADYATLSTENQFTLSGGGTI